MTHVSRPVLALLLWAAFAGPCWGQRFIPVPRISPPRFGPVPIPVHPIHPGAGPSDTRRDSGDTNHFAAALSILAGIGAVVALLFALAAWKGRAVASLRIVRTPPGEAPEAIRRAWVGVELPLRREETGPGRHLSVGVLSQQGPEMTTGYAVDGHAAVRALASHSPEAAAWWREHAPHVVARGGRLWFPCEVCEVIGSPPL